MRRHLLIDLSADHVDWSATPYAVVLHDPTSRQGPFDQDFTAPVVHLLACLRAYDHAFAAGLTATRRIVLMSRPAEGADHGGHAEALFEALRGIAGALTLDWGLSDRRINVVRASRLDDDTVEFLTGPGADFVAGASLDLAGGRP